MTAGRTCTGSHDERNRRVKHILLTSVVTSLLMACMTTKAQEKSNAGANLLTGVKRICFVGDSLTDG